MRALQVSHSAQLGGSNTVLLSLLRHAPAWVDSACIFLEDGPAIERVRALGVRVALVPSGRTRHAWLAPRVVRQLRAAMRDHRSEVVFSHVNKAHLYAGTAAWLEGIPALWWQQEHAGLKPFLQRAAARVPARAVLCSANWIAAEQRSRGRGTPVRVVHPGVETAELPPMRRHSAGTADEAVIGVVCRLARWKRVELAIRAMPLVRRRVPRARLRIIGAVSTGDEARYLEELAAEAESLGVRKAVELVVAEAGSAMSDMDVLVHPAEREPWGLVLLEALATGVPVIAADDGGPREIVRDGRDGLLADVQNTPALASALIELITDPARRNRMGAAGRQRVLEQFNADRAADDAWALIAGFAERGATQERAPSASPR